MKRSTKTIRLAAVAAAGTLVLAACGGGDGGGGGDDAGSVAKGDGTLTVGTLLPSTGDLAFLGPPEFAGVDLAVKDINEAGGVLGKDVVQSKADSGDGTPKIAPGAVDKLLGADVDVIIGAASSSVSLSVIDKIINAGVVHVLAGQHLDRLRHLRRQGHVLPYRSVGRAAGQRARQPGAPGRCQERRDPGPPGGVRRGTGRQRREDDQGPGRQRRGQGALQRRRHVVHVRDPEDQGRQAGRHRADRLQRDHEDHPGASSPPASARRTSRPTSSTATPPTTARTSRRARSRASRPPTRVRSSRTTSGSACSRSTRS